MKKKVSKEWKKESKGGFLLGIVLFVAAALQQIGLISTTASNAAFITGMYIVFVPLLGFILKQKVSWVIWLAASIALFGLYLLSVKESVNIIFGDYLEFAGALIWAVHILLINHFVEKMDAIKLAFFQFLACSILSIGMAISFEQISMSGINSAIGPIIYGGICSVGIAYTLQIIGQKNSNPSQAALILSLEAIFGAVGGIFFLQEFLGERELLGCTFMLVGTILAQLPSFTKEQVRLEKPADL